MQFTAPSNLLTFLNNFKTAAKIVIENPRWCLFKIKFKEMPSTKTLNHYLTFATIVLNTVSSSWIIPLNENIKTLQKQKSQT